MILRKDQKIKPHVFLVASNILTVHEDEMEGRDEETRDIYQ